MKRKNTVVEMARLASEGLSETRIIAVLEISVKYAKVVFGSDFFKKLVIIKKKENAQNNSKKN